MYTWYGMHHGLHYGYSKVFPSARTAHTPKHEKKDNVYICILNAPTRLLPGLKIVLSQLLAATYGIDLKWEPHGDNVVWGEGKLSLSETGLSLTRKGISPSLDYTNPGGRLLTPCTPCMAKPISFPTTQKAESGRVMDFWPFSRNFH